MSRPAAHRSSTGGYGREGGGVEEEEAFGARAWPNPVPAVGRRSELAWQRRSLLALRVRPKSAPLVASSARKQRASLER